MRCMHGKLDWRVCAAEAKRARMAVSWGKPCPRVHHRRGEENDDDDDGAEVAVLGNVWVIYILICDCGAAAPEASSR